MIKLGEILKKIDYENVKRFKIYFRKYIQKNQIVIDSIGISMTKPLVWSEDGKTFESHDSSNIYNITLIFDRLHFLPYGVNNVQLLKSLFDINVLSIKFNKAATILTMLNLESEERVLFVTLKHKDKRSLKKLKKNNISYDRYGGDDIIHFKLIDKFEVFNFVENSKNI